ncbi:MAG: DUF481 domain-containing protein [Bacteroidales bacterium]|nr:DUF481 domain-containing protein [Bacteroidales bacterium]
MNKIVFVIILSFITLSSSAQLVNIEKKRIDYKQGFQGNIAFAFNIIQNTSKITQGSNSAHLQYVNNKHTFLILNDYTLMKVKKDADDYDLVNQNFQHFRYNFSIVDTTKINFETFVQRQQNKIKYLNLRFLAGAGFRFRIIDNKVISFYIAPLIMYENEILSDSFNTTTKMIKGDLYWSLGLNFTETVSLKNVTYYQPAFFDLAKSPNFEAITDFRLFSELSLSFVILKNLEYSAVFELAYDSRPPMELVEQPLFYNLKNQLVFKF